MSISTADTLLESNQSGASFGYNVSTAGDVNGDGYDDVIVGAFSYDGGLSYEGAAFIYHGSASGVDTIADTQFESNYNDARLGSAVSRAGDVNGDGYDDVIVGAGFFSNSIDESNEGAAFVYHGSATGVDPIADSQLESNQRSAFLDDVSGAGDVNGDGYDDVIVGFGHFDGPESNEGVAFVYYGSAAGVDAIADVRLEINQPSAVFGSGVSGAGDVNGDGYDDVIVGSPLYDNGQSNEGAAFIYHGGASGLDAIADTQLEPNQASALMGAAVSGAGDVNGDGYDDVIVTSGSKPFLYFGGSGGVDGIADVKLEIPISCLADSVSGAGDVNGDGYDDVIVGSHFYDSAQPGEGVAFLYYGSASGMDPIADGQFESNQNGAEMGWSASTAGDVDRDGYDDVIVGAHRYDNGQTDEGAAFIYHGSSIATIGKNPRRRSVRK